MWQVYLSSVAAPWRGLITVLHLPHGALKLSLWVFGRRAREGGGGTGVLSMKLLHRNDQCRATLMIRF